MPDNTTVRLDVWVTLPAREYLPQHDGAAASDPDEEQESCDQQPNLFGILFVVMVRESCVRRSNGHFSLEVKRDVDRLGVGPIAHFIHTFHRRLEI